LFVEHHQPARGKPEAEQEDGAEGVHGGDRAAEEGAVQREGAAGRLHCSGELPGDDDGG
jgi:hypothetical protein